MLAPDEQMLVDFGKLIRNQIPDKNGYVLPPDLTSGAYRIRDLEHNLLGALYEGKVIVDKTYGHAAYGCGVCGPDAPTMAFDPLAVSIDDYADQYVQALDSCGGGVQDFTGDFSTWWTGDTAIATANRNSIHGVAAGTTNHYAESDPMYWGIRKAFNICPVSRPQTTAKTNVLSAIVTLNSSDQVSATDGASTLYKGVVGSLNLGIMAGQLGVNNACYGGNELVGTVSPSTSAGPVTVKRTLTSGGCYKGSTAQACPVANGADDTGTLIATNPQNVTAGGSANGHVYNLDTPGVTDPLATTPNRVRYNFTAYAVGPDGVTPISPNLSYYVVLSCINGSSGVAQLSTGISGDNKIGLGTTKTSWNLQ